MSIEKDFNDFAQDSREFQGEVRAWMKGTTDHIAGVSAKADAVRSDLQAHKENLSGHGISPDSMDKHKDDLNAHGSGLVGRSRAAIIAIMSLGVSVAGLSIVLFKWYRP